MLKHFVLKNPSRSQTEQLIAIHFRIFSFFVYFIEIAEFSHMRNLMNSFFCDLGTRHETYISTIIAGYRITDLLSANLSEITATIVSPEDIY